MQSRRPTLRHRVPTRNQTTPAAIATPPPRPGPVTCARHKPNLTPAAVPAHGTAAASNAAKNASPHRMILYNSSHSIKEILLFRMYSISLMSILS